MNKVCAKLFSECEGIKLWGNCSKRLFSLKGLFITMSDIFHRPLVSEKLIIQLTRAIFNLEIAAKGGAEELESYEDRNFMVCGAFRSEKSQEYVDYESKIAKR